MMGMLMFTRSPEGFMCLMPWAAAENCAPTPPTSAAVVPFNCNDVLYDERGTKALVPSMMYVWNDVEKNNGAPPQNIMDKTFSKKTRHAFCEHVRAISVAPFYGYDWNKHGKACSECVKASASGTSLSSTLRCMGWS